MGNQDSVALQKSSSHWRWKSSKLSLLLWLKTSVGILDTPWGVCLCGLLWWVPGTFNVCCYLLMYVVGKLGSELSDKHTERRPECKGRREDEAGWLVRIRDLAPPALALDFPHWQWTGLDVLSGCIAISDSIRARLEVLLSWIIRALIWPLRWAEWEDCA